MGTEVMVWEGVGGCGRVWEGVGGSGREWEGVGGCGMEWEGVGRMYEYDEQAHCAMKIVHHRGVSLSKQHTQTV